MAVPKTTITGKLLTPDGVAAAGAQLEATLSQSGTADDGGTAQWVGGKTVATVAGDGTFTLALVPNDGITPAGTYYDVTIRYPRNVTTIERWNVEANPDPIDIGDIERVGGSLGGALVVSIIGQTITVADASTFVATPSMLGFVVLEDDGSGETAAYRVHRTASGEYVLVYELGGATGQATVSAEPDPANYPVGAVLVVDTGSGETYAIQRHRDAADVAVWIQTSSGGS